MNEVKSLVDSVYFREIQILKIIIIQLKCPSNNLEQIKVYDRIYTSMETRIIKKWFAIQVGYQTQKEFIITFCDSIFNSYKKIFNKYEQSKIDSQQVRLEFNYLQDAVNTQILTSRVHLSNVMLFVVQFSRNRLLRYLENDDHDEPIILPVYQANLKKEEKDRQIQKTEFLFNFQSIKVSGLAKQLHSTKISVEKSKNNFSITNLPTPIQGQLMNSSLESLIKQLCNSIQKLSIQINFSGDIKFAIKGQIEVGELIDYLNSQRKQTLLGTTSSKRARQSNNQLVSGIFQPRTKGQLQILWER